ncbi:MAG: CocE/NonD family hydrolase [Candidatus Hodarchaeales archaeon]|jgi:putative CocE/NonD family hydrolase
MSSNQEGERAEKNQISQYQSNKSYYLPMRDRVRLAISFYFPDDMVPTSTVPTILIQTRYGREWVYNLGEREDGYESFRKAGYAIAIVDDRGSTASFGSRLVEISPEQVKDTDEIIDHITSQTWSNSQVFTTGVSYMADTADISTGSANPYLKGAIVREADFDMYRHLLIPGGVANDHFIHTWGSWTTMLDTGRMSKEGVSVDCANRVGDCEHFRPNITPVDEDKDLTLVQKALRNRERWSPDAYKKVEFRDDEGENGFTLLESSPASRLKEIAGRALPVQYWGSWMDAGTAAGALDRYCSLPNVPMEVWITSNDHHNKQNADPFLLKRKNPNPSVNKQRSMMRSFLKRVGMKKKIYRLINYYVLGTGKFKKTSVWPPLGVKERFFCFSDDYQLTENEFSTVGEDIYHVDFTATTGEQTRWSTQFGAPPNYLDRREEDKKLLVYTGAEMEQDMELVGNPFVTLYVKTKTSDPAFYIYLEDVAPDGYVTYLTEGVFRGINRKLAHNEVLPYDQGPVPHTFSRTDAEPMRPEKIEEIRFALFPIAAKIKRGHRLRVAIAGADGKQFRRYSQGQSESFIVYWGGSTASGITIPLRSWRKGKKTQR